MTCSTRKEEEVDGRRKCRLQSPETGSFLWIVILCLEGLRHISPMPKQFASCCHKTRRTSTACFQHHWQVPGLQRKSTADLCWTPHTDGSSWTSAALCRALGGRAFCLPPLLANSQTGVLVLQLSAHLAGRPNLSICSSSQQSLGYSHSPSLSPPSLRGAVSASFLYASQMHSAQRASYWLHKCICDYVRIPNLTAQLIWPGPGEDCGV